MDKFVFDGDNLEQIDADSGEVVTNWVLNEEQSAKFKALIAEIIGSTI